MYNIDRYITYLKGTIYAYLLLCHTPSINLALNADQYTKNIATNLTWTLHCADCLMLFAHTRTLLSSLDGCCNQASHSPAQLGSGENTQNHQIKKKQKREKGRDGEQ